MSLDVYLDEVDAPSQPERWTIFIRDEGGTKEISLDEWNRRFPGREPLLCKVGGDVSAGRVYTANITHNLNHMADAAGIYNELWRPDEIGVTYARDLIEPLRSGLVRLASDPDKYKALNPENGWGTYEGLVGFVERYLDACRRHPNATVSVWR